MHQPNPPCTAQDTISLSWRGAHELARYSECLDLKELNMLAGVIQKLAASHTQLSTLQLKREEHELKLAELKARLQELEQSANHTAQPQGLTDETLIELEHRLKLL